MMLLRTLVLEHSGEDAPVNGALLCGFAVPQIASNFLVYSLDEEIEPGSSRVYVAALRRKVERYFLGGVDTQEDLQVAMRVFKQILTLAASGTKSGSVGDGQIPYHFVDLKGCKLPPARPEDHHSMNIKKALVMKVITLGTSAPASEAIESPTLIVPSIRFSSKLVSAPKVTKEPEKVLPVVIEGLAEPQRQVPAVVAPTAAPVVAVAPSAPPASNEQAEHNSLFEVDSTLTNLARVAQELTQQKLAMQKREEALEQRQVELQRGLAELEQKRQELTRRMVQEEGVVQLQAQALEGREAQLANAVAMQQQGQRQMDERTRVLEERAIQVEAQELRARQKGETLAALLVQLPGLRQNVHAILFELDQALDGLARNELVQASSEPGAIQL
ncbi:hypothetical protein EKA85_15680 [Pseudomonas veronii]|uniref:hypothetical protein n=1 Tax=Pseudomonas TaxID=286 RepID=UPI000F848A46|nr:MULTISPECIES: hypothetical protein [Pseudomonas]MDY7552026.1 hypothetical protein [Pseudomonas sp. FG1]MEB0050566.1 hypothetical protein [Pseudomonas sp. FG1]RTY65731.1 hypothetical protein EKA85_15680 [Pseudomonas veronii]